jgi:hypothetical protein
MRGRGYNPYSQMASKPSAGPKTPIDSGINRKPSGVDAVGAGNSP